jgi:hypothetical protein
MKSQVTFDGLSSTSARLWCAGVVVRVGKHVLPLIVKRRAACPRVVHPEYLDDIVRRAAGDRDHGVGEDIGDPLVEIVVTTFNLNTR